MPIDVVDLGADFFVFSDTRSSGRRGSASYGTEDALPTPRRGRAGAT